MFEYIGLAIFFYYLYYIVEFVFHVKAHFEKESDKLD